MVAIFVGRTGLNSFDAPQRKWGRAVGVERTQCGVFLKQGEVDGYWTCVNRVKGGEGPQSKGSTYRINWDCFDVAKLSAYLEQLNQQP